MCRHTQLNVCDREEFPCFLYLIQIFDLIQPRNRDFLRILPATSSSRHLSTTNQRFKQEDSNDKNQNDGGNDKQFENMMKFVALTTGGRDLYIEENSIPKPKFKMEKICQS